MKTPFGLFLMNSLLTAFLFTNKEWYITFLSFNSRPFQSPQFPRPLKVLSVSSYAGKGKTLLIMGFPDTSKFSISFFQFFKPHLVASLRFLLWIFSFSRFHSNLTSFSWVLQHAKRIKTMNNMLFVFNEKRLFLNSF